MMIDVGNRSRNTQKGTTGLGLSRTVSAFGIVGMGQSMTVVSRKSF